MALERLKRKIGEKAVEEVAGELKEYSERIIKLLEEQNELLKELISYVKKKKA